MSKKQIMFDNNALIEMKKGVDKLADAVKVTMGPAGRHVVIEKSFGGPHVTKDGVSVSKEIALPAAFESMGAKMVNEVAKKVADKAGDGTTAATVLAQSIFTEGLKVVAAGANPVHVQRGIAKAAEAACDAVDALAIPCKGKPDYKKIATVSANHDEAIGELIAEAISKVGPEGVVEVEDGKSAETTLEYVEGMQFDKGYLSPYFMTDPKTGECVLEECHVLIHEKKISNLPDLLPLLNKVATSGKPLLIIAEEVENEALAALVVNRLRGVLNIAAVKAPGFGDRRKAMLGDIAVVTGGTFFSEDLGRTLESVELKELGRAKKVVVTKEDTTVIEGAGRKTDIKSRAEQIKAQQRVEVARVERMEMKARKDLVDDALHATRAAAKDGYVAGGGVALLRTLEAIEAAQKKAKGDEKLGFGIVLRAVEAPAKQIAMNAGIDGDIAVEKAKEGKGGFGLNAATHAYEDLSKAGIIDPAMVVKSALTHAASVAGLMLTTDVMITELKEDAEPVVGAVS